MKGFFVSPQGTQYHITTTAESWKQGSTVTIRSHKETNQQDSSKRLIVVAHIDLKKLKKNDTKAFTIIYESSIDEERKTHQIKLDDNCPISDGQYATYILCAKKENLLSADRLVLPISPKSSYLEFINILELFYRFKLKTTKYKKGSVDCKFSAPGSKELGAIEQMNILFSTQDDNINLDFIFKVKKLQYTGAEVVAGKVTMKEQLTIPNSELFIHGDSFNQDKAKQLFDAVIDRIKAATRL